MTPERAMEIARSITESIYKEEIAQAILTACEAESKLAAAAMAEKCADVAYAHKATMLGPSTNKLLNDFGFEISIKIRSISPAGVLESHDQAARLEARIEQMEEIFELFSASPIENKPLLDWTIRYIDDLKCRLAALRATPQPTAVQRRSANGKDV